MYAVHRRKTTDIEQPGMTMRHVCHAVQMQCWNAANLAGLQLSATKCVQTPDWWCSASLLS